MVQNWISADLLSLQRKNNKLRRVLFVRGTYFYVRNRGFTFGKSPVNVYERKLSLRTILKQRCTNITDRVETVDCFLIFTGHCKIIPGLHTSEKFGTDA